MTPRLLPTRPHPGDVATRLSSGRRDRRRALGTVLVSGVLSVALAGCMSPFGVPRAPSGGGTPSPVPSGAMPTSTTSSSGDPSSVPGATPTDSTPDSTAAAASPSRPRTAAALNSALIVLDDLPSGWAMETSGAGGDGAPTVSSTSPSCRDFVALANAGRAPGSLAVAATAYSGGQDGPYVTEEVDALPSRATVGALLKRVDTADRACTSVRATMAGSGSSTFSVRVVSPPQVGDHPVAVRLTARGGDLDGLELTQFYAGVDDTIVVMTFAGAYPEDIDGGAQAAVGKAADTFAVTVAGV